MFCLMYTAAGLFLFVNFVNSQIRYGVFRAGSVSQTGGGGAIAPVQRWVCPRDDSAGGGEEGAGSAGRGICATYF